MAAGILVAESVGKRPDLLAGTARQSLSLAALGMASKRAGRRTGWPASFDYAQDAFVERAQLVGMETNEHGLIVASYELGPAMTNAYLIADGVSGTAIAIDPAWDGSLLAAEAERRDWRVTNIWLTHAHFDHFGGAAELSDRAPALLPVALHPEDYPLWKALGGARWFGFPDFDPGPEPTIELTHGAILRAGGFEVEVRHAPGHTPGHVLFVVHQAKAAFVGDVIFESGVGRVDLPGGDWATLLRSIDEQILSLPDDTRLFTGHGPPTTVGRERATNPFLVDPSW